MKEITARSKQQILLGELGQELVPKDSEKFINPEQAERARIRQGVVMPILSKRRWKRGTWATEAGVGKNSVYQYLDGTRNLTPENRRAMAEMIDLKPEDLPSSFPRVSRETPETFPRDDNFWNSGYNGCSSMHLRLQRNALGISQSKLSRISGVSRFKICMYELDGGSLTPDEHRRIREALLSEANRLRNLPLSFDLGGREEGR